MKHLHGLTIVTLLLCIFVFVLTIGDYLALHDIWHDYVSQPILSSLDVSLSAGLPDWTETRGEWRLVTISFLARVVFLVLNGITLFLCVDALRRRNEGQI